MSIFNDLDPRAIFNALHPPRVALVLKVDAETNRVVEYSLESIEDVAAIVDILQFSTPDPGWEEKAS